MSSKIIPSKIVHPDDLTQFPLNSNIHPDYQIDELIASRQQFSQYRNVVVWICPEDNGELKQGITYVLAGNGFHLASLKEQDQTIEVKDYSHLTLEEAILLAETDNAASLGSQHNPDQMQANLERAKALYVDNEQLERMLNRAKKLAGVNGKEVKDITPQIDKAAELQEKWGTELGQLWQLGDHRLVCGDCTDKAVVEAVMEDTLIDFFFTDPPYGVAYGDKNRHLSTYDGFCRMLTDIEGDQAVGGIEEIAEKLWRPSFSNMYDAARSGCVYYMTMPQGGDQMMMMMMMMSEKWLVKHELIWVKDRMVFGRADYHYQHEPIMYGWKPGASHYFVDDRTQVSIWEIPRPMASKDHPTEKPLELVERAMCNSSKPGDICADFFVGSGTTLIAAENLGRKAWCIEIEPKYIAVTLQRFYDLTGREPALL